MKKIITLFLSLFAITSIFAQSYVKGTDYKLSTDEKTLERWLGNQTDVDMKSDPILNNVKHIGIGAFANYDGVTPPNYPSGYNNSNNTLNKITFPENLESIGEFAFVKCKALSGDLILPASLTKIGNYAFENCPNFTGSLTIPDKVETIGYSAFFHCIGFTGTLTIGSSVTEIGSTAFSGCIGFNGVLKIGSSVTVIGEFAFDGCFNFTGSLTIPDKVEKIEYRAFDGCTGFNGTLTIGSSVNEIYPLAFKDCNFTSITSLATVPPKTDFAKDMTPSLNTSLKLFVPKDSEQDYKNHEYWGLFNIEANTAGIKDFKSASIDLRFYPSPVDNVLNIDCESGIQEYALYNMAGKLLANRSFAEATVSCEVDMSQLEEGMYLIHIKTKAGQTTFKVMKK